MSWTFIQSASATASGTSVSATLGAGSYSAGNLIVVGIVAVAGAGVPAFTVADGASNNYSAVTNAVGNSTLLVQMFYGQGVSVASGGNVITVTATHSATIQLVVLEYQGSAGDQQLGPNFLDAFNTKADTSASPSTNSVTVSRGGELLVGLLGVHTSGVSITPTGGMNSRFSSTGSNPETDMSDQTIGSAQASTWTLGSSQPWAAMGATFLTGGIQEPGAPCFASQELIPPEWQE